MGEAPPRPAVAGDTPSGRPLEVAPRLDALRAVLAEATALGLQLRISGAAVEHRGLEQLPPPLRERLDAAGHDLVWSWLGGEAADEPALALLWDQLDLDYTLVTTRAAARAAIRQLECDKRTHGGLVALDCETTPKPGHGEPRPWARINKDGRLSVRQPKIDDRTALDPHCSRIAVLSLYAGGRVCQLFRGDALDLVLSSHWLHRQRLVAHNAGFDLGFVLTEIARRRSHEHATSPARRNIQLLPHIDCTSQAAGLLHGIGFAGEGRALNTVAETVLGTQLPKTLQMSDWGADALSPGQMAYASLDAIMVWRLHPLLQCELCQQNRGRTYQLQRNAIPAVVGMELRGIRLDGAEHARQVAAWAAELEQAREDYTKLTGRAAPATPNEVREWLQSALGEYTKSWPRTDTGMLSITAAHLRRLAHVESAHPVLRILATEKLLANFGPTLAAQVNRATGRIHPHYAIAGAKSGRFTCDHPNLQQLPGEKAPEFRRCIIAADGDVLIGCDYSQIELRAAAWLARDRNLTVIFVTGRDVHDETAGFLLGIPADQVNKAQRKSAKAINFGSLYGMQAPGLVEYAFAAFNIQMTIQQAEHALRRFALAYPQIDDWKWRHYRLCKQRGYVSIGCGRVVQACWEPDGHLRFSQCCNLPIQGIAADAMLRAVYLTHVRLRKAGLRGRLIATIHDELLCEAAEEDAAQVANILQTAMLEAFTVTFPGAPTNGVAKAIVGRSWADLKD